MLSLTVQKRENFGKKVKTLRKEGLLPSVLYGPKIKSSALNISEKEFEKIYKEAGESSLILLKVGKENFQVLIHEVQRDPLSGRFLHVDFYQPLLTEKIQAKVPILFGGEAGAVKELGGTLVKNITEIEVKALPQDLPHEIKVDLSKLKTFKDYIFIKDLQFSEKVEILRAPEEIVAHVVPPEKVEEELEKPIEEKIEEVEKIEKPEKEPKEAKPRKEETSEKKPPERK